MMEVLNSRISIDELLEHLRTLVQGRRQVIQNLDVMNIEFTRGSKWEEDGLCEIQYRLVEVFIPTRRLVAEETCMAHEVVALTAGRMGSRQQLEIILTTRDVTIEIIMVKSYQNRKRR